MIVRRQVELRRMLEEGRNQLKREIACKQKTSIENNGLIQEAKHAGNSGDMSSMNAEQHLEYRLLEIKGQTLSKIKTAIRLLDEGTYGQCGDCGEEISLKRLRALPFAIRCRNCEERRENEHSGKNKTDEEAFITGLSSVR